MGCFLLIVVIAGVIGARVLNAFLNLEFYFNNPQRFWSLKLQGFSVFGAFLAIPFGWIYCRLFKLDLWKIADSITPFLGFGIALMRMGCFLNGCCYGKETKLPWGVAFPSMGRNHLHQISENPFLLLSGPAAVHPTQLYELLAALTGGIAAFFLLGKKLPSGAVFLVFAIWFSVFRFLNNFLRVPPSTFDAPELFYPVFYIFFISLGGFLLFKRLRNSSKKV